MENRSRKKTDSGITFPQVLLITAVGVLVTLVVFFYVLPALSEGSAGFMSGGNAGAGTEMAGNAGASAGASGNAAQVAAEGTILPEGEAEVPGDAVTADGSGSGMDGGSAEKQVISVMVETTAPPETEPPKPVVMRFAGDILFDSRYAVMASLLERTGGKPAAEQAFDVEALSLMRGADIFMVNNEFPYSLRGTPLLNKQYTFRADPAYAALLTEMGTDIVSLANNHMFDHGEDALLDTLDTLAALKLPYVGAGKNIEEASASYTFEQEGMKITFLSATQIERLGNPDTRGATETLPGVFRCLNDELLCEKIKEAKASSDIVVAYVHWGTESTEKVDEHQKKLAKDIAEFGADLIIGDHPHVLQGIEYYGDVPCIYSLGNYWFNSRNQDSCLFEVTLDPEARAISAVRFIPMRQENCRVKTPGAEEAARIIEYMNTISAAHIDRDGYVTNE